MFDRKGQIRIIESFLAIAVVFSAVLVSFTFPTSPDLSKQRSLVSMGIQALMELDADGTLGNLILQQNWTRIKTSLDVLLPMGLSFNLTVYDQADNVVNSETIQNSNLLGLEAVAVQYVCATRSQTVEFFVVRLQLAWTG
ncbi:MAG TPA: hypothetical protein VJ249_03365 [Candidatus Bathyarchaeia archaeon]|nr:hypothetical protein [Candidatus Bathyarchaeia archaeon]